MANTKIRRKGDRVGALSTLRGSGAYHYARPDRPERPPFPPDVLPEELSDRDECRHCRPCGHHGPGGRVHATTDCPLCETCSGWPLFYTGPCGLVDDAVECAGACPQWMRYFPASAQLVATAPIRVSEDGNIRFRILSGDAEMFLVENGVIRLMYPGRYLIAYTAQIPCGATIDTRLAVTLDNERIFASEVEIEGSANHTRLYSGNALVEAERGDAVALEATNGFEIDRTTPNLPIFTMVITRLS